MIVDQLMLPKPVRTAAPPASTGIITLEQAKAHLRVDHSTDDTLIGIYLDAAVQALDGWGGVLGRCLTQQSWRQDMPEFPTSGLIRLPLPDVVSITSVTYLDSAGGMQTMDPAGYAVANDALGGAVVLKADASWPSSGDAQDAVKVTFVAGYGTTTNPLPASIKAAILLHIGVLYDHRAAVDADTLIALPLAYETLIAPYRMVGV